MKKVLGLHSKIHSGKPEPQLLSFVRQTLLVAATTKMEAMIATALGLSGIHKRNMLSTAILEFKAIVADESVSPGKLCHPTLYQLIKTQQAKPSAKKDSSGSAA